MAEIILGLTNFRRGDTKKLKIDYGDNVNITGYKHWLTLRRLLGDPVISAQVSSVVGNHALDEPTNGKAWLQLESDVSSGLDLGPYVWDVQRVLPGTNPPDVLTLSPAIDDTENRVIVFEDVTKVNT